MITLAARSIAVGIFTFAAVFGLITALRLLARRIARRTGTTRPLSAQSETARAIDRAYRNMIRTLDRAGHTKPPWQPPASHIDSLDRLPENALADARTITNLYYRAAFSGNEPSESDARTAETALSRFRESLHRTQA
jgi:hypothetical protein